MQRDEITNGAGAAIVVLVIMTNGYSVMAGSAAGRSVFIAHIAAGLLALLGAWWLTSVCEKAPDKTFFDAITFACGSFFGRAIALIFSLFSLVTCVISLTVFSRFVQITALPQTPQIILPLIIILIAALSNRRGLFAAAGSARLLIWFFAAVFLVFVLFGIKWTDPRLLIPDFKAPEKILAGAGEVFLNRFGASFALMAVYTRMEKTPARRKTFMLALFGASLALAVISLMTVATLGEETSAVDFYPVFTAMSVRGIGGFIQHTETLASIAMTLCLFFKSAVCLAFSEDMLTGTFKALRRQGISVPLALICAAATQIIYRDISSLRGMVEWKSGAGAVVAIYVLLPLLLVLFSKTRRKTR